MVTNTEILDLLTFRTAYFYDLDSQEDRNKSVRNLEKFFFRLCGAIKPRLFVEAGAKDAAVSMRARRYLESSRIVAFEASPVNFEEFKEDARIWENDIEYCNLALSDRDGSIKFNVRSANGVGAVDGRGSILDLQESEGVEVIPVDVPAVSIDGFFKDESAGLGADDIAMWVDVEGALEKVFMGGRSVLRKVKMMFVEVEDRPLWDRQWMRKDVLDFLSAYDMVPVARDYQSRYQYNMVLAHSSLLNHDRFRFILAKHFSDSGGRG